MLFLSEIVSRLSRPNGLTSYGRVRLTNSTVGSIDLRNTPTAKPPIFPTVHVTACVDVRAVRATDKDGRSLVPASRKRYLIDQLTIVNINYPSATGWRVSSVTNAQADSC